MRFVVVRTAVVAATLRLFGLLGCRLGSSTPRGRSHLIEVALQFATFK
jgi:hypothetical protein